MTTRELFLSKNFTVIASPIDFTLKFNARGWDAESAEDVIHYKSGWYIFDNNSLLAPRWNGVRNPPKYNAFIEYDETQLNGAEVVTYTCYVNPKSIDSLNTDVTEISAPQMGEVLEAVRKNEPVSNLQRTKIFYCKMVDFVSSSVDVDVWIRGRGYIKFMDINDSEDVERHFDGVIRLFADVSISGASGVVDGFDFFNVEFNARSDGILFFEGEVLPGGHNRETFISWLNANNDCPGQTFV